MLRPYRVTWLGGLVRGSAKGLAHMYIDVSFPLPSSAPYLDIQVHRLPIVQACIVAIYCASASIDWVAVPLATLKTY